MVRQSAALCFFLGLCACSELRAQGTCAATEVIATHLSDANTLVDCTDGWRQMFSFPTGTKVMPYRRQVLSSPYGGYHQRVTKFDLAWIANTITIDQPLRSFGGDIILYADTININAPIDSRVYFEHDVDFFAPGDPNYKDPYGVPRGTQKTDNATYQGHPIGINIRADYTAAFREYYLKCFDCVAGETRIAELPSGLAAPTAYGVGSPAILQFDGQPAPDSLVVFPEARAGNVYIFARTINIATSLSSPSVPPYRAECDQQPPSIVNYAVNAGGLAGGRGGAGSVSMCLARAKAYPNSKYIFDCVDQLYTMKGGLSGAGGRGADGGDVHIEIVSNSNQAPAESLKTQLIAVTNIKGGAPGSNKIFRTPAAEGADVVQPNRCSFKEEGSPSQMANPGKDGSLDISSITTDVALQQLARYLTAKDVRFDYDYFVYLNMAKSDPALHATNFSSSLSDYLSNGLVDAELKFAADVDLLFGLGQPEKKQYVPPMLSGLGKASFDEEVFGEQQQSLLREVAKYDDDSDGTLSVFRNFGGMFHVATKNTAVSRMSSGQLLVQVAIGNQTLTEIKDELRNINSQLFSSITGAQRVELQNRISKLKDDITRAEDEAIKQAQSNQGLASLLPLLKNFGEAVTGLFAAVASDNYLATAEALKKTVDAYQALMTPQVSVPNTASLDALRKQLATAISEYEQLTTYINDQKASYFAQRYVDLDKALKARNSITTQLASESFLFPDLLKVALISYFDDTFGDKGQLRTNLKALQTYLRGFPTQEPFIKLSDISWTCTATDCQTYQANVQWREVRARMSLAGTTKMVPLYILAPIARATPPLPLFLLDPASVSVKILPTPKGNLTFQAQAPN